ncbi:MAG: hypothetical protein LBV80_00640 [Deltaproteobacteria bacterium]|jgi:hypothetical protein|nr:hypothetical protein [Deltaproteobacteria bacterium]
MANLKEIAEWVEGIYRIEETDPVVGGEDGIDNIQAKQLGSRTLFLKKHLDSLKEILDSYSAESQEAFFAGMQFALDQAGLAGRELTRTNRVRFQEIETTIVNRGIKSGVAITKSDSATRNISVSDGAVFMRGRLYPVLGQTNTASVASNTTAEAGTVILYMFLTAAGAIDVAATTLNGTLPEGAIELARATVPAGNTEENDPYLSKVSIVDSARREPNWPQIQIAPARAVVALSNVLPDARYLVDMEVLSLDGGRGQLGDLTCEDRLNNGFKLQTSGLADNIKVRMLVQHPAV